MHKIILYLSICLAVFFNSLTQCLAARSYKNEANALCYQITTHAISNKTKLKKKQYKSQGMASWYGEALQKKKTSSGERYNMHRFTAAHKTLPLSSYVLVTNLSNQRQVVVRVNDRGPYTEHRIIDLSYAAAKQIGMVRRGTTKVSVEAVSCRPSL